MDVPFVSSQLSSVEVGECLCVGYIVELNKTRENGPRVKEQKRWLQLFARAEM